MIDEQDAARPHGDMARTGGTAVPQTREGRATPSGRSWATLLGLALLVVICDQVSKRLIDHHLVLFESWPSESWPVHLVHVSNTGAAFSILQNQTTFLIFTSVIGLGAILLFFFYPPFEHSLLRVALGLQLGGAVGNLIDRVVLGSVTDFIKFPHYPAFNVADSSIVVGVMILVWFLVFREEHHHESNPRGHR